VTIYAQEKLIAQARQLAAEYRRTMGKPLPGISTEIAEFDAVRLLGLEPRPAGEEAGYNAVDPARGGKRIQIKARTIFDEDKGGQRVGQLKMGQEWDSVVLQYLAAATGYLLAQQRGLSDEDKAGYLDELAAFSRHVLEDVQQRARQQSQTTAAKAFGYWEPPKR